MLRKFAVLAVIVCAGSCVEAGNASIGSVVAQGELRMDGHSVQGSGTVFDGTMVETGSELQSTADLRLSSGTKITLHNNSSGTLYRDRFVLIRGEADMDASGSFRVEVSGLVIKPSVPGTSELIAIAPGGAVSVLARTGQLQIEETSGQVLAQIHPQQPQAFSRNANGDWQIGGASSQDSRDGDQGCNADGGHGDDCDHHHRHHHHSH